MIHYTIDLLTLGIVFLALVVGYVMGRLSAKPVVIDPFQQSAGRDNPVDLDYTPEDEWEATANKREL